MQLHKIYHMTKKRKFFNSSQKGFTLLELLLVIVIIGILSSFMIVNYIGVRQRARDAKRKADLRQIQSALELYRSDQGSYLTHTTFPYQLNTTNCVTSNAFTGGTATYMKLIPCDPSGTSYWNNGNYYYYSNGTTYTLAACLENKNDQEGIATAPSPAGSGSCTHYYVLTNP